MASRKLLTGATDGLTGIIAHDTFEAGDRLVDLSGVPLVQPSWLYGSGADGDATISSNTTLTTSKEYENLTIADGVTLNTGGNILRIRGTLSLGNGSRITWPANNASGSTAGAAGTAVVYGIGGAGSNGQTGTGNQAVSIAGFGGTGGKGGNALTWLGQAGGLVTAINASAGGTKGRRLVLNLVTGNLPANQEINGGSGGSGGAGDVSGGVYGLGGGGGAGGRVVVVFAHRILVPAGTATVAANGGNGANGVTADGGGGGGGGGGVAVVVSTYEQPAGLTIEALGGTGGTANGSATNGDNGSAGVTAYYRAR